MIVSDAIAVGVGELTVLPFFYLYCDVRRKIMHKARFGLILILALTLVGCSKFGFGGKGSGDDLAYGDGNIPLAQAGSELTDINFDFDSSELNASSQNTLRTHATWLLDKPNAKVVVEGHCDERGTSEYNLALGERRARSVFDYLRSLGVPAERMSTISYGKELPLDPASNDAAWAKNRRAHFSLSK